jgi:hypothetical protein
LLHYNLNQTGLLIDPMTFELITNGRNEKRPLIYRWEIWNGEELVGLYVGKSKNGSKRPYLRYKHKVKKLLSGEGGNTLTEFRRIHQALAVAVKKRYTLQLYFICNVEPYEDINLLERKWINHYKNSIPDHCCLNDKKKLHQ